MELSIVVEKIIYNYFALILW